MRLKRQVYKSYFYFTLACLLTFIPGRGITAAEIDQKAKLTAAFIYQITKFTTWPTFVLTDANQPFSICVLGQDENRLYEYLAALESKSTHGRAIEVTQLTTKGLLFSAEAPKCEVLYSSNQEWQNLSANEIDILAQTTLLIGGNERFLAQGGMLALVIVDDRMRIFINSLNIENTPIKLESRLKALAKSI